MSSPEKFSFFQLLYCTTPIAEAAQQITVNIKKCPPQILTVEAADLVVDLLKKSALLI